MLEHFKTHLETELRRLRREADYYYQFGIMKVVEPGVPGHATRYLNLARTHFETGRMWYGKTLQALDENTYPYPNSLEPENCFVHPAADTFDDLDRRIYGDVFKEAETQLVQKVKRLRKVLVECQKNAAELRSQTAQGDVIEGGGLNPYECLTQVLVGFHNCALALGLEVQDMLHDNRGGAIPTPPKPQPGDAGQPLTPDQVFPAPVALPPLTGQPGTDSGDTGTNNSSLENPSDATWVNSPGVLTPTSPVLSDQSGTEVTDALLVNGTMPSATLDSAANTDGPTPPALPPTSPVQPVSPSLPPAVTANDHDYSEVESTGSTETTPTSNSLGQLDILSGVTTVNVPFVSQDPLATEPASESSLTQAATTNEPETTTGIKSDTPGTLLELTPSTTETVNPSQAGTETPDMDYSPTLTSDVLSSTEPSAATQDASAADELTTSASTTSPPETDSLPTLPSTTIDLPTHESPASNYQADSGAVADLTGGGISPISINYKAAAEATPSNSTDALLDAAKKDSSDQNQLSGFGSMTSPDQSLISKLSSPTTKTKRSSTGKNAKTTDE